MDLLALRAVLSLDKLGYEKGLDDAVTEAQTFGDKLKGGLATAAKVGTAAIGAASTAAVAFGKQAIDAGSTFDASMSQVAATMGYSVEELNTQGSEAAQTLETLRNFAQEMGSSTAFSASQSADALNYMALAGYDAETAMKMLPNVLNLAAAGGMDLASASDMVTDAQSALGLSLDETSEMVDKMAKASSQSNTSVAQLGEAFLTIGGTAKNLAGGTTELSTALGILADNGIKGSEGGTALRNIILSLSAPTDKAALYMERLGLEVYDAEGNMRPLNQVFGDLNNALSTMTQGERTEVLSELFNKVDLKSANALLATDADRWTDLAAAIDDSQGAAENMANTQLDNLAGDITLFQSAMEGAKIAISDGLTPTLRTFVQFGTDSISTLTTAFREEGLAGAMNALGDIINQGLAMLIETLPQVIDSGVQLLMALIDGIIQNLPALANAALQIILSLAQHIADSLPELVPTIVDVVLQIVQTLTEPSTLATLVQASLAIIVALAEGLINALPTLLEKAPIIIAQMVAAIIALAPQLLQAALQLMATFAQGIVNGIGSVISAIGQLGSQIFSGIGDIVSKAWQWGADLINNFTEGLKAFLSKPIDAVKGLASKIKSFLGFSEPEEGPLSNFHTYAPDMMQLFAKGITDNRDVITDAISNAFDFGSRFGETAGAGSIAGGHTFTVPRANPASAPTQINLILDNTVIGRALLPYIRGEEMRVGIQLAGGVL